MCTVGISSKATRQVKKRHTHQRFKLKDRTYGGNYLAYTTGRAYHEKDKLLLEHRHTANAILRFTTEAKAYISFGIVVGTTMR